MILHIYSLYFPAKDVSGISGSFSLEGNKTDDPPVLLNMLLKDELFKMHIICLILSVN